MLSFSRPTLGVILLGMQLPHTPQPWHCTSSIVFEQVRTTRRHDECQLLPQETEGVQLQTATGNGLSPYRHSTRLCFLFCLDSRLCHVSLTLECEQRQ